MAKSAAERKKAQRARQSAAGERKIELVIDEQELEMHRAAIAGGLAKKWQVPSQFIGADGVQAFVDEVSKVLKDTLEQNQILDVIHGGANRVTWSHQVNQHQLLRQVRRCAAC